MNMAARNYRTLRRLENIFSVEPDQEWQDDAICAQTDPEAFFPEKGGSTKDAKAICRQCPVQAECLDYALAHDERFGIWGGHSERERRRLKRGIDATPSPGGGSHNPSEYSYQLGCTCDGCRQAHERHTAA